MRVRIGVPGAVGAPAPNDVSFGMATSARNSAEKKASAHSRARARTIVERAAWRCEGAPHVRVGFARQERRRAHTIFYLRDLRHGHRLEAVALIEGLCSQPRAQTRIE